MRTAIRKGRSRTHLCLAISEGADERLRQLAVQLGYLCKRGPGYASQSGSISGLVEALASGELMVISSK